jgi:hypothetical protein
MMSLSDWQPIETAPTDGTAIQAEIPGHGADNIIAFHMGLVDEEGDDCGGWCFVEDQEPPDSWTDGWCWAVNEDGEPSVQPTRWKPLPEVAESETLKSCRGISSMVSK